MSRNGAINEAERALSAGAVAQAAGMNIGAAPRASKITPLGSPDPYAQGAGFARRLAGRALRRRQRQPDPLLRHRRRRPRPSPDTGTGGELYAIIGHAPRQLDRNIAIVGRVIEGIEHLSSLPRGTEAMGFYKEGSVARRSPRDAGSAMPAADASVVRISRYAQPGVRGLSAASRKNRDDDFYRVPAGGVDLCNVQVPVVDGAKAPAATKRLRPPRRACVMRLR